MSSIRRIFTLATMCAFLAACGGGGGGSSSGGNNNPPGGNNPPPTYTVSVSPGSVQFSALARGTLPAAKDVTATFNGEGLVVGTPTGASLPSWLTVSVVGSPTSTPAQVRFSVNTTGTTADSLATTVRFVTGKADGSQVATQDVPVTYTITDPLALDLTDLTFEATANTVAAPRTVAVLGSGTSWTVTSDRTWLTAAPASGTNSGFVEVTANATAMSAGIRRGQLRFVDSVSGDVRTVAVTFNISSNRWNVARTGVQLLGFADSAARPAHVVVTNESGTAATWTATTDVNWLTVTSSGASGDTLTIEPDATLAPSLSDDTIYIATVTVSGGGIQSDTLRVGFYRSSAAEPTDVHAPLDLSTSVQPAGLAVDPIRPYVYVGLSTNTVRAVNIVTGAVLPLFTAAADAKIGRIVVSGDGQFLYASSIGSTGDVLRFNLDVGAPLASLPRVANCCAQELVWLRSRGVPLLVTGHFEVYNAETGAAPTPVNVPVDGLTKYDYLAGISDGSELWAIDSVSATGDACSRAASFHVVSRPADGSGYLTPFRSGPKIGLTTACPSISQLASSSDGANVELIGQNAGGTAAFFEGPRGGAVTEISSQRQYEHLAVGSSGLKALSFVAAGAFADGVEVLDATNSVVHTFEQLQGMEGVRFSSDDRFLLVLGSSQSASGDLHVLKIP
jgi:hypothetical protein